MTATRMEAEIVTGDPGPIVEELTRLGGFELEIVRWPDEMACSTVVATTFSTLSEFELFEYMDGIVTRVDSDPHAFVHQVSIVREPSLVGKPGIVKQRFGRL